jgi:hypothetical protein
MVEARHLIVGNTVFVKRQDGTEEEREITAITHNIERELIRIYYKGYIGDDLFGSVAMIAKKKKV